MIAQRLESVSGLSGRFAWVPADQVRSRLGALRPFVDGSPPREYTLRNFDAQDKDTAAIADWIRAQLTNDEPVTVLWISDRQGISIGLYDFLLFFDELWYPSSDDVIVESHSGTFVIVIDHEEQVRLFLHEGR
jgi:hypothetical protein